MRSARWPPTARLRPCASTTIPSISSRKVKQRQEIEALSALLDALEYERGLERLTVKLIAVIESPRALEHVREIADGPRLIGISLGSEDFALSLGRPPAPLSLGLAAQTIAYAASARGLMGIAMATSI